VTGDKEGYLRLFHRKEDAAELECVLTRTSGAIWCCAFSCSGIYVFVAGEEPGVVRVSSTCCCNMSIRNFLPCFLQVIDIADRTVSIASENAPMQAIRELVVDPLGDYFLSIGERGAVGLWSLNQNACVSTIYNHAISADWRFDGSLLVISTNTKELGRPKLVDRKCELTCTSIPGKRVLESKTKLFRRSHICEDNLSKLEVTNR